MIPSPTHDEGPLQLVQAGQAGEKKGLRPRRFQQLYQALPRLGIFLTSHFAPLGVLYIPDHSPGRTRLSLRGYCGGPGRIQ